MLSLALCAACERHAHHHDHIIGADITHVRLVFTDKDGKETSFTAVDEDGVRGSREPVIEGIELLARQRYELRLDLSKRKMPTPVAQGPQT